MTKNMSVEAGTATKAALIGTKIHQETAGVYPGDTPGVAHPIHRNRFPMEGTTLFIPLTDVARSAPPLREPNTVATRQELFIGTAGLFRSFERVFDQTYTGGRSNKSFIGMAVEVTVDHGEEKGGKAEWTVHHSPMMEGGDYVRLRRKTAAYNGYDEISEVSFVRTDSPTGKLEPSVTFTSYLIHRENHGNKGPQERFEVVDSGKDTHGSWDSASRLLHDFAEIANTEKDKVSFKTIASRSPVVSQAEMHQRVLQEEASLVADVESSIPVQRPDGSWTTRNVLVAEAQAAGTTYAGGKKPEHLSYAQAFAHRQAAAINGGTVFDQTGYANKSIAAAHTESIARMTTPPTDAITLSRQRVDLERRRLNGSDRPLPIANPSIAAIQQHSAKRG